MKKLIKGAIGLAQAICLCVTPVASVAPVNASATTIYGDVNNDGSVNSNDIVLLNRYLSGKVASSSINMKYSDVDKNTVIDVNDMKTLKSYVLGTVSSLPYSESGNTFNYSTYSVPADESRTYLKYNCSTGGQSIYTLSRASTSSTSTYALSDNREIDSSANAQAVVKVVTSTGTGTGFIVSDHVIATAAHCVYNSNTGNFANNVGVKVYNATGTSVVATYQASQLHVPFDFLNDSNYDYGLIYVEESLSSYGNISLGIATDNFRLTSSEVNISGFPSSVENFLPGYARYYGSGEITSSSGNYMLYSTAYANSGDSGGPVYIEYTLNGTLYRSAIGIHRGHTDDESYGVRITLPVLRFFMDNPRIG